MSAPTQTTLLLTDQDVDDAVLAAYRSLTNGAGETWSAETIATRCVPRLAEATVGESLQRLDAAGRLQLVVLRPRRVVMARAERIPACGDPVCLSGCRRLDGCPRPAPLPPPYVRVWERRMEGNVYRCARCGDLFNGCTFTCECKAELHYWGGEAAPVEEGDDED